MFFGKRNFTSQFNLNLNRNATNIVMYYNENK